MLQGGPDKGVPGGGRGRGTDFATSKAFRVIYASAIIGAGVFFIAAIFVGGQETFSAASRLGGAGWAAILGLSIVNYCVRFGRWRWYLGELGHRIPIKNDLLVYVSGFALTMTPAKAGEAIRSLYLRDYKISYEESIAVLFVERLTDTIAMIALAFLVVTVAPDVRVYVLLTAVVALLALVSVRNGSLAKWLGRIGGRGHSNRGKRLLVRVQLLLQRAARLTSRKGLFVGLGLGVLAWGAEAYGFWVVLNYLKADVPLLLATGIYAAAILAGAVSFVPGGLGSTEAVMGFLLILSGVDTVSAIAATIICRIATLWFAVALGFLALVSVEIKRSANPKP